MKDFIYLCPKCGRIPQPVFMVHVDEKRYQFAFVCSHGDWLEDKEAPLITEICEDWSSSRIVAYRSGIKRWNEIVMKEN